MMKLILILLLIPIWANCQTVIGSWTMEGNANDNSGNANDGATVTNISYVAGRQGLGASFNGSSSYILTTNNTGTNANNVTIEFWVKPTSITNNQYLVGKSNATARYQTILGYQDGYFNYLSSNYPVNATPASSQVTATAGVWQHIVFCQTGSTNYKAYLNGNLIWDFDPSSTLAGDAGAVWIFGAFNTGSAAWYGGVLDEIKIYNAAVTNTMVKNEYALKTGFFQ